MVASNEFFSQAFPGDDLPPVSQRQARREAVMQAAENLALTLHAGNRLSKALSLVLADAITLNSDGTACVQSGNQTYTIDPTEGCECEDAKRHTRLCKHYIATLIAKRAAALLQGTQHGSEQEQSQESISSSASLPSDWQIHEAPVACTMSFVCKGVDVHLTMRDTSDEALFARIKRILPKIQDKNQTSPADK